MKKIIVLAVLALLSIVVLLLIIVSVDKKVENKYTLNYVKKTGKLLGVVQVKINADKSITLFDAKPGHGLNLMMLAQGTKRVDFVTLRPGKSCLLSDGRHVFITYKFKKLEKGKIIFVITDKFNARSFGDGIKEETNTISITPYKKKNAD